jgi:pyridoxamine 5'-phosphate oxidase
MSYSNAQLLARMRGWLEEAKAHPGIAEPTAMSLGTVDANGAPSVRIVLLKSLDERGLSFFTNRESRKVAALAANPQGALCFYWMPLKRQLRVEGKITQVSAEEADAYFASRARDSQLGAWASAQSRPLESADQLRVRFEEAKARFEGKEVPRPPYWGGYRLIPNTIEFWQERPHRLHERELFTRVGGAWEMQRLFP